MPLTVKRHKKNKIVKCTNKKRVRKQHSKLPKITIPHLSQMWDDHKSAKKNLDEMGLSYDPNVSVGRFLKSNGNRKNNNNDAAAKLKTVTVLESEAKAPRKVTFKYPKAQALYLKYLISKYGDDYKAMAKDRKNIYQETWKQIRSKVTTFRKLEQYRKVLGGVEGGT